MTAFVDIARPAKTTWAFNLLCILSGSVLISLLAQCAYILPWTPVPITLQTLGVLLMGALLGKNRGALAVLAYLAQGAAGLPVFAAGTGGAAVLIGPTAGYLWGFALAAYLIGTLLERGWKERYSLTLVAMVVGSAVIYLCGAAWLSLFVGSGSAFALGVAPFLIGDCLKMVLAAMLVPSGWKLLSLFE